MQQEKIVVVGNGMVGHHFVEQIMNDGRYAITVIGALLYLPFGKFFHIFQRPAQLGVKLYKKAGDMDGGALCPRCGGEFASQMQIDDVRAVLTQLGFDYTTGGPAKHWQALCPPCKRKSIALSQLKVKEQFHG